MADVPFSVLMKQAAALKTSQLAVDRTKFDSWDCWYQHSLFAKEDVKDARRGQKFNKIMDFARECKKVGNDFYKESNYDGAINQYERCLSLFDWVEPTDPDWKNKGIQDKLLEQKHYPPDDHNLSLDDVEEIEELKLTCLLNLSMCYWKTSNWSNCIRASSRVLEIDPRNTKALYRRAQARIIPAYCGTTENMMALEDLKKAVAIKPDDTLLTTAYAELKISLSEQKKKDKKTFNNLFERSATSGEGDQTDPTAPSLPGVTPPSSGGPVSSSSSKGKEGERTLTWQDAFNVVKDMESAALQCERDGQRAQAATIRAKKDELQKQMKQYFPAHLQTTAFPASDAALGEMSRSRNTSFGTNASSDSTDTAPGIAGTTSPSSSSAGKKGKAKHTNGTHSGPSPSATSARSSPVSAHGPATASTAVSSTTTSSGSQNKSKVITAAGGERSAAWFDAYGNDEDFVDFGNPTQEMILDAQSRGLDLTDPRVQQLMQEINKVRLKNTRMEERLGRGAGAGKGLAAEGGEVTTERMEAYMQEALENMHSEEANRITSALVADVAVPALRKMLRTRQEFLLKQRAEEANDENVPDEYASKVLDASLQTHTGSTFRRSSRASSKPQYIPIPTTVTKLTSSSTSTNTTSSTQKSSHNNRDSVYDVDLDPLTCDADDLRTALQAMMVADIVQLRKDLGKEELEAQRHAASATTSSDTNSNNNNSTTSLTTSKNNKPVRKGVSVLPPPKTPLTDGLTPQEAEEEAQRLSLSERIVDMLEERYGTAMHTGAAAGGSTNAMLRNATVVAGIACVVLIVLHLCIRLYIVYQQNLDAQNADIGAFRRRP